MSAAYVVRVKICGLSNREEAEAAVKAGADALGFNLFSGSKRFLPLDENADWICSLPPFVTRVAVLVNAPLEDARRVAQHPAIDMVQLHGDEDESYCAEFARLKRPFIKALRPRTTAELTDASSFSTSHILLDAHVPGAFGGTGITIDLSVAAQFARVNPHLTLILAGGLTPFNVADAIQTVRPFAVDVASGVETSAGGKSCELMSMFLRAAKAAVST